MNINVNDYKGSDSERIQAAIEASGQCGGIVLAVTATAHDDLYRHGCSNLVQYTDAKNVLP